MILLRQKIHGEMDAFQPASGRGQVAGIFASAGQRHGVIFLGELAGGNVAPDVRAGLEGNALGFHLPDAAVDGGLFHFEIGNAVAQQPAGAVVFFVDDDLVAGAGELLGAGEPGRAGADHGGALAGFFRGRARDDPALAPGAVDDGALDGLDGDRVGVDVEGAGGLAGGRADAAGEFGEVVGGVQDRDGAAPVVAVNEVVPVGDDVVDRASGLAVRDSAVHASRPLPGDFGGVGREDEFAVMPQPLVHGRRPLGGAGNFQKSGDLAHPRIIAETAAGPARRNSGIFFRRRFSL